MNTSSSAACVSMPMRPYVVARPPAALVRCACSSAARFSKRTVLARMGGSGTGAVPVSGWNGAVPACCKTVSMCLVVIFRGSA
ncbi:hypothetical protein D3C71_1859960 [compost metagenome]